MRMKSFESIFNAMVRVVLRGSGSGIILFSLRMPESATAMHVKSRTMCVMKNALAANVWK